MTVPLDLTADVVDLLQRSSTSRASRARSRCIADAVEAALSAYDHLEVVRDGHTVVARTHLGRAERVVIGGHLDTVPENHNMPSRRSDGRRRGPPLRPRHVRHEGRRRRLAAPRRRADRADARRHVDLLRGRGDRLASSTACAASPTSGPSCSPATSPCSWSRRNGVVEAGCQGTMRVEVRTTGTRSHSARSWMGHNAIHDAGEVLRRLAAYEPRAGRDRRPRLPRGPQRRGHPRGSGRQRHPRRVRGGGQLPLRARRARAAEAEAHLREVFDGLRRHRRSTPSTARCPASRTPRPRRSSRPSAASRRPKFGWTDVARFTALGVPAVNYGPGDPSLAHHRDEFVPVAHLARRRGAACAPG